MRRDAKCWSWNRFGFDLDLDLDLDRGRGGTKGLWSFGSCMVLPVFFLDKKINQVAKRVQGAGKLSFGVIIGF